MAAPLEIPLDQTWFQKRGSAHMTKKSGKKGVVRHPQMGHLRHNTLIHTTSVLQRYNGLPAALSIAEPVITILSVRVAAAGWCSGAHHFVCLAKETCGTQAIN